MSSNEIADETGRAEKRQRNNEHDEFDMKINFGQTSFEEVTQMPEVEMEMA